MDIATIINLLAIGNGIFSIIFLIFIYSYKNNKSALLFFTTGKILQTITWLFFIFFKSNLTTEIMIIANIFQYFGLTFEVFGFVYIFNIQNKKNIWMWIIICSLFVLTFAFFASNIIYRVFISSCWFFGIYTFMFIRLIFSKIHSKTQYIVGCLAIIFGLIHFCRGLFGMIWGVEFQIYNNSLIQVVTGYMYIIITFTFPVFLLLIIIEMDNKQLYELNIAKNKLFRIIGHDLKSPMIQMTNVAEIIDLKKGRIGVDELEKLSLSIRDSSKRTSKLLDDLLNWAQSQSNSISIKLETIKIRRAVCENIELFKEKLNKKNIKVLNDVSESDLVNCDNNMLNTIIRNLLSNAIKFSFDNSTIDISSSCNENFCVVLVKDAGMGIKSDNLDKLFKI